MTRHVVVGLALTLVSSVGPSAQQSTRTPIAAEPVLQPTNHPRLPADPSQFWMAPSSSPAPPTAAVAEFAAGVKLAVQGNYQKALPIFSQSRLTEHPLAGYALYYKGLSELRVGRLEDARRTFQALAARTPVGFLSEGAALREAEASEALGDERAALAIYERLSN